MAAEDITWHDGAGNTFNLQVSGVTTRLIEEIRGLGMPTIVNQAEGMPFWDGERHLDHRYPPRIVRVAFRVIETSKANWWDTRRTLMQRFNPKLGEGYLEIRDDHNAEYRLYCRPQAGPDLPRQAGVFVTMRPVVELKADYPFLRSASENSKGPGTSLTCNNAGDVPTYPRILVAATNGAATTIQNTTRSKSLVFTGSSASQKAIKTGPPYNDVGVVTAKKVSDSANQIGYLTTASDVSDFALARGVNTLTSSTANITVKWYDYYLGV